MHFKILAFGIAKDIVGARTIEWEATRELTIKELIQDIISKYPELKDLASIKIAVNEEYVEDQYLIQTHDEVALIPPVSGG